MAGESGCRARTRADFLRVQVSCYVKSYSSLLSMTILATERSNCMYCPCSFDPLRKFPCTGNVVQVAAIQPSFSELGSRRRPARSAAGYCITVSRADLRCNAQVCTPGTTRGRPGCRLVATVPHSKHTATERITMDDVEALEFSSWMDDEALWYSLLGGVSGRGEGGGSTVSRSPRRTKGGLVRSMRSGDQAGGSNMLMHCALSSVGSTALQPPARNLRRVASSSGCARNRILAASRIGVPR